MTSVWSGKHLFLLFAAYAAAACVGPLFYASTQVLLEQIYPSGVAMRPTPTPKHEETSPKQIDLPAAHPSVPGRPSAPLDSNVAVCPTLNPYDRIACFEHMRPSNGGTYKFTITNHKPVIVDPKTRHVIEVIE